MTLIRGLGSDIEWALSLTGLLKLRSRFDWRVLLPARLMNIIPTRPSNRFQTVGILERQHPSRVLRRKSADLVELLDLVFGEFEFHRRKVVLKLVDSLRPNDDRGDDGLR